MEQKYLFGLIGLLLGAGVTLAFINTQKNTPPPPASPSPTMVMNHGVSMDDMVNNLKGKTGDDFDKEFIKGMIEHHAGAIKMAESAKNSAKHTEIKQMADDIIKAQSNEINQMKSWQQDWGY